MKEKLRLGVSLVFDNVVAKGACLFLGSGVLVIYRNVCRMNDLFFFGNARLAVKHLCTAVELINNIGKVSLIKQHFEIKRVQIRVALAVL